MRKTRIIAIGVGGAAEWLENLACAGLGQLVMIDPDVVSETNLATQQTYRRGIGRAKVDCIAGRILDINHTARIMALQESLDDISDNEMEWLAKGTIAGTSREQDKLKPMAPVPYEASC
jgi:tRNA A37 threonylcarbamoyladenosine dehydratase